MPIVFVHGVNTRKGQGYEAEIAATNAFLSKHLQGASINGKQLAKGGPIEFPYWGNLATEFAWNMASLPDEEMQALGGAGEPALRAILAGIKDALAGSVTDEPLVALAKHDFPVAMEIIGTLALEQASADQATETAEFVVAIQTLAEKDPNPRWLANTTTDGQLLGNLNLAVAQDNDIQAQGIGDVINAVKTAAAKLKEAAGNMIGSAVDGAGDFASTKLLGWTRPSLNATLGRFFGDIFIYFDGRGDSNAPGDIPKAILAGIDTAIENAPPNDPLVIIGHSLGGVISFDLLGHFRPDLQVDLFVSVGSQVAHFEEMKLFMESDDAVRPPAKAKTPANILHWINVYDEVDIFSYACDRVFDRVDVDARYDTKTYVIKAHSAFFKQARFYKRLRARVDQLQ